MGLSPTPCWERLKRLEKAGIIEGYGARISLRAFGAHVTVFVAVELDTPQGDRFPHFEQAVQAHDEITGCWALGGGFDYLLQVVARDIDAYQRLIDTLLEARIGLARYYTYVVTKPVKDANGLPISAADGRRAEPETSSGFGNARHRAFAQDRRSGLPVSHSARGFTCSFSDLWSPSLAADAPYLGVAAHTE